MDREVHEEIMTVVLYAGCHNLAHSSLSRDSGVSKNVTAKAGKITQDYAVRSRTPISLPLRSNNIGRECLHNGRISEVIDVVRRMEAREWPQLRPVQAALSTSFILRHWCANHRSSPIAMDAQMRRATMGPSVVTQDPMPAMLLTTPRHSFGIEMREAEHWLLCSRCLLVRL